VSRARATVVLPITAVALFGLSTLTSTTRFCLLTTYMMPVGGGSGLFNSPDTGTAMASVAPNRRRSAAGVRTIPTCSIIRSAHA
jgi:hypothetical protein